MPVEIDADAISNHVPVLAVLAERLESETEAALAATTESAQLLHVGGLATLSRLIAHEVNQLLTSVRVSPSPKFSTDAAGSNW